jgi:hypothetical protein
MARLSSPLVMPKACLRHEGEGPLAACPSHHTGVAVCSAIQRMKSCEPSLTGNTSRAGLV